MVREIREKLEAAVGKILVGKCKIYNMEVEVPAYILETIEVLAEDLEGLV